MQAGVDFRKGAPMAPPPWAVPKKTGVAVNGAQEFVSDFGECSK